MALIVGTNSYVSLASAEAFFQDRAQSSAWLKADDATKNSALITATGMIDLQYQFIGVTVSDPQALAWPRSGVCYGDPRTGRLTTTNATETPQRVTLAVLALALHLIAAADVLADSEQVFEKIKIGPIELTDNAPAFKQPKFPSEVSGYLAPLLVRASRSNSWWRAN